jgi:50S ribosomal protein L16 3-hydroxylase
MPSILGDISVKDFLATHWQKKPLLIRNAFPDFVSPLSPDEVAGLACDEDVESRIVESGNDFRLRHGPFRENDFAALPDRDWTLLVQDVEKHLPDLAELIDRFAFIPAWRIDDLMISVAAAGGGVGPHVDAYDVFLLQANGRRRWSIAERFDPAVREGIDLKVLEHFSAEQEWILEPGDMLYLPPNVAHDGVALDDNCMTFSIGFRAPDAHGMLTDLVELVQQRLPDDSPAKTMYTDPDLAANEAAGGKISPEAFRRARSMIRDMLTMDDDFIDEWFGRFVTEPKAWLQVEPDASIDAAELRDRLRAGDSLFRDTRSQLAWREKPSTLFVDGDAWPFDAALTELVALLCTSRRLSESSLTRYLEDDATMNLLVRLYNHGSLYFIDAD